MKTFFPYCFFKYHKGIFFILILFFAFTSGGNAQVLVQDFDELQDLNQFQGSPPSVEQVDKINLDNSQNGPAIFSLGSDGADKFLQINKATNERRHFDRITGLNDEPFLRISFDFAVDSADRTGKFAAFFIGDNLYNSSSHPIRDERWAQIGIYINSDGSYNLTHEIILPNGNTHEVSRTAPFTGENRISTIANNSEDEIGVPYEGPNGVTHLISRGTVHIWVGNNLLVGPASKGSSSSISAVKFLVWNNDQRASARMDNISITKDIQIDPLPVELLRFSAQEVNEDVQLNWTTAAELNSSHFVVERSLDGANFTAIGKIAAAGNSQNMLDYSFIDKLAVSRLAGMVYYRLHQVDIDGGAEYSAPVQLLLPESTSVIRNVFPNPFKEQLKVQLLTEKGILLKFRVLSLGGEVVLEEQQFFQSSGQSQIYSLPQSQILAAGIYVLELTNGEGVQRYRVVKL